jgi:hypothetical protein
VAATKAKVEEASHGQDRHGRPVGHERPGRRKRLSVGARVTRCEADGDRTGHVVWGVHREIKTRAEGPAESRVAVEGEHRAELDPDRADDEVEPLVAREGVDEKESREQRADVECEHHPAPVARRPLAREDEAR